MTPGRFRGNGPSARLSAAGSLHVLWISWLLGYLNFYLRLLRFSTPDASVSLSAAQMTSLLSFQTNRNSVKGSYSLLPSFSPRLLFSLTDYGVCILRMIPFSWVLAILTVLSLSGVHIPAALLNVSHQQSNNVKKFPSVSQTSNGWHHPFWTAILL